MEHSLKRLLLAAVLLTSGVGCLNYEKDRAIETGSAGVVVTSGDVTGHPYRVLGPVDFSGQGSSTPPCGPDEVRRAAVQQYGRVNAIINFTRWQDGSQSHCGGTAVVFTDATGT